MSVLSAIGGGGPYPTHYGHWTTRFTNGGFLVRIQPVV